MTVRFCEVCDGKDSRPPVLGVRSTLSKPRHPPVSQRRTEAVKPDEEAAADGEDDLVPAAPHGPDDAAGDFRRRHRAKASAGLRFVSEDMVKELALRRAGTDQEHVHLLAGQLRPEGVAETMQGKLAGAVLAFEGDRPVAEDGAHVHDKRMIPFFEKRERGAREFHGSEEVDLHDFSQALFVRLVERTNCADSRVIDQAIESAEPFLAELQGKKPQARVGDVARKNMNGVAAGLCFLFERDKSLFTTGHGDDLGALAGKLQNQFPPDAAGSSGHEDAKTGKRAVGHEQDCERGQKSQFPKVGIACSAILNSGIAVASCHWIFPSPPSAIARPELAWSSLELS